MALKDQYVNNRKLVHVSVTLEFLADLCADGGDRDVKGVHGLDLGGLNQAGVSHIVSHNPPVIIFLWIRTTGVEFGISNGCVYVRLRDDLVRFRYGVCGRGTALGRRSSRLTARSHCL